LPKNRNAGGRENESKNEINLN